MSEAPSDPADPDDRPPPPDGADGKVDRPTFPGVPAAQRPAPARPSSLVQGGSLRLVRVAGIDVFVHWSWVVVAYFQIRYRSDLDKYNWPGWLVVEYLALFGIVLLHEFGHALACRSVGGTANRIILWPLGGVALVNPPPRPGPFLWTLAAGPLVNVMLAPVLVVAWGLTRVAGLQDTAPDVSHLLGMVAAINIGMLIFNLLPIFPLDGGQILQGLLWFIIGRARSLMVVTILGLVTAGGLLALMLSLGWWWAAVIAAFLLLSSFAGLQRARGLLRIANAPRREGLRCPSCGAVPPVGEFWSCVRCRHRFDVFEHEAVCPYCGSRPKPLCPECYRWGPLPEWYEPVEAAEATTEEPWPADPV
jgi:Zn-dependent protease